MYSYDREVDAHRLDVGVNDMAIHWTCAVTRQLLIRKPKFIDWIIITDKYSVIL